MSQDSNRDFSAVERWLYRLALSSLDGQLILSQLETRLYRERLAGIDPARAVFITSLPRAGTTALLNVLASLDEFGSHTYRDMPFVLCPLFWDGVSKFFRRSREPRERAQGDGVLVSPDSPEALEEVVWQSHWPEQYQDSCISLWPRIGDVHSARFLVDHFTKIISLRCPHAQGRYLSKNNLNIARIPALLELMPECSIIVPFREPLQHAASLLRQHRCFLEIHARDPFASFYMRSTGHFDFGENLRPVDFDGWWSKRQAEEAMSLEFWLEYWVATFGNLLGHAGSRVHFVSFETLCQEPGRTLTELGSVLGVSQPEQLVAEAERLTPQAPHPIEPRLVSSPLARAARQLHGELLSKALAPPQELKHHAV